MKRAVLLTALGLASIAAFGATQAEANTYCAELPGDASCTQNFSGTTTSIQAAVEAADENPGPDTVKVGPGTFVMPSPVYLYSFGEDNRLTLTGSGPSTVLSGDDPAEPEIHFNGPQGSSINSLTVSIPDEASNTVKRGLVLTGDAPVANDLDVNFVSNTGNRTTGVVLQDGATLRNSTVTLYNTNVNTAVASSGGGTQTVAGSTLTAFRDVDQRNTSGTVEIRKSALIVIGVGGLNLGGTMNIRDSVIVNPYNFGYGIFMESDGAFADTLIEGTTMLGTPGETEGSPTVGAEVISAGGNETPGNARFRLNNSVIHGYDHAIAHNTFYAEDTLKIEVDASAYDSTRVGSFPGLGTPNLDIKGLVDLNGVDPKLKDPGNGDYSLAPGSPLIDAGQAIDPAPGSLDFSGNPRACHGTAAGVIRRDIGAYEFKTDPEDDCTYPVTSILAGPQGQTTNRTPGFTFATTKNPGTYLCSWDGQPEAACAFNATAPDLGLGTHNLSVRTRDPFGNIDQTPETWSYEVVEATQPTCETDPTLCPVPPVDKTAPKVIGLKAPRKTKLKRIKVRFKSNEKGVTFTCKLNKGKAKKCRSPWKTPKLRKGKNTIQIQATDKAGNRSKPVKRVIRRK